MNDEKSVLIVDDVFVMRHTIKRQLNDLGYDVVGEARNGYEAIEQYKALKPDFVTMDITMPQVNEIKSGIEALSKIKQYDPNAIIILVTSHSEKRMILDGISKGARGYILKPITQEKLTISISKVGL